MTLPVLDELYVVSDLHLGGRSGFQIFCQGETLTACIRRLALSSTKRRIGLVLNGDIVDFLAEEVPAYLDPLGAVSKLARITEDPAFSRVWEALADFVAQPGRQLILVLGNHDVELALPPVRQWLLERLAGDNAAARGRITTAMDGAGFACRVGDKQVLCIHGNEADDWNVVDYRALLDVSRALNRGEPPPAWDANAGTRLVIDVMNQVKQHHPMVDLLKPEHKAVVPILLILDPGQLKAISKILTVAGYLARNKLRMAAGFLSAEQALEQGEIAEGEVMAEFLGQHFDYQGSHDVSSLLMEAYEAIEAGADPTARSDAQDPELLGPLDFAAAVFGSEKNKAERLRGVLADNLRQDRTYDIDYKDRIFTALDQEIGAEVDYLIAGHTHLERAIERRSGCYYFNSGTWIRLIRLGDDILNDSAQFERVYRALKSDKMADLDALNDLGPKRDQALVMLRPTVVSVIHKNGKTFGELQRAQADGALQPVPNSRFPRS